MSIMEGPLILDRIRTATPYSPIAVFTSDDPVRLEAVFAACAETQRRIQSGDPRYIGSFHCDQDRAWVKTTLSAFIKVTA